MPTYTIASAHAKRATQLHTVWLADDSLLKKHLHDYIQQRPLGSIERVTLTSGHVLTVTKTAAGVKTTYISPRTIDNG